MLSPFRLAERWPMASQKHLMHAWTTLRLRGVVGNGMTSSSHGRCKVPSCNTRVRDFIPARYSLGSLILRTNQRLCPVPAEEKPGAHAGYGHDAGLHAHTSGPAASQRFDKLRYGACWKHNSMPQREHGSFSSPASIIRCCLAPCNACSCGWQP